MGHIQKQEASISFCSWAADMIWSNGQQLVLRLPPQLQNYLGELPFLLFLNFLWDENVRGHFGINNVELWELYPPSFNSSILFLVVNSS